MKNNILTTTSVGQKKDINLGNYQLEFDMKLMTYVLYYKGKEYPLNINNKRQAHEKAEIIMSTVDRKLDGNNN
jgi:hypothetical protein